MTRDPGYTAQVFATPDLSELGDDPLSTYERQAVEDVIGSACNEGTLDDFLAADPVETPFVQTTFFTPCFLVDDATTVPCSAPHDAEYTGVTFNVGPDPLEDEDPRLPSAFTACEEAFNAYVPAPPAEVQNGLYTPYDPAVGAEVRCVVFYGDLRIVTASVRD